MSGFSSDGMSDDLINRIGETRVTLANLWNHRDLSISVYRRVHSATDRAVILYGCDSWSPRAGDASGINIFDHHCIRNAFSVLMEYRNNNDEVRRRVFGKDKFCR